MTPHRTHRLARLTAVGLAATALAAPAASARPASFEPPASSDGATTVAVEPESSSAGAPVVRSADEGFDWASAAIGAGAAGAVLVLSLGGLGGQIRQRTRMRVAR
jgi:hypothetical protein